MSLEREKKALSEAFQCGRVYQQGSQITTPWEAEERVINRAMRILHPRKQLDTPETDNAAGS